MRKAMAKKVSAKGSPRRRKGRKLLLDLPVKAGKGDAIKGGLPNGPPSLKNQ
jgi:hypothetical protein